MAKHCKTCKHWVTLAENGITNFTVFVKDYGHTCNCPKLAWAELVRDLDKEDEDIWDAEKFDPAPETDDMLVYFDYDRYGADFVVGPEFGCIHHEERDASQSKTSIEGTEECVGGTTTKKTTTLN